MRTVKQIKNFSAAILRYLLTFFFSFYTRRLFVDALGVEYLGVAGLMGNVLGMLAIAELGIGTSIVFSLYKPLAEKDQNKIHLLIELYRKLYRFIAIFVLIVGLGLMPFLTVISPDLIDIPQYNIIYLMFLANSVIPYFFAYNSTLYTATQQDYKLQNIRTLFYVLTMGATIIVLTCFPDYILLTACTMLLGIASQLLIYYLAHRKWPWLNKKAQGTLNKEDILTIKNNVRGMVFHKIGSYCIHGTSSLIIANTVNLFTVGLYANYQTVAKIGKSIITEFFNAMTAGLGEKVATDTNNAVHHLFNEMNFLSFWLYGNLSVCFYFSVNSFIDIWLGNGFQIPRLAILFIALDIYVMGMRIPCAILKSSAGMFTNDQYVPIFQSIINLSLGFFLGLKWGITGVVLAILLSGLFTISWYGAYVLYRDFFIKPFKEYIGHYILYSIIVIFSYFIISYILELYLPSTPWIRFIYILSIVVTVYNSCILIMFNFLPGGKLAYKRVKSLAYHIFSKSSSHENHIKK